MEGCRVPELCADHHPFCPQWREPIRLGDQPAVTGSWRVLKSDHHWRDASLPLKAASTIFQRLLWGHPHARRPRPLVSTMCRLLRVDTHDSRKQGCITPSSHIRAKFPCQSKLTHSSKIHNSLGVTAKSPHRWSGFLLLVHSLRKSCPHGVHTLVAPQLATNEGI